MLIKQTMEHTPIHFQLTFFFVIGSRNTKRKHENLNPISDILIGSQIQALQKKACEDHVLWLNLNQLKDTIDYQSISVPRYQGIYSTTCFKSQRRYIK